MVTFQVISISKESKSFKFYSKFNLDAMRDFSLKMHTNKRESNPQFSEYCETIAWLNLSPQAQRLDANTL